MPNEINGQSGPKDAHRSSKKPAGAGKPHGSFSGNGHHQDGKPFKKYSGTSWRNADKPGKDPAFKSRTDRKPDAKPTKGLEEKSRNGWGNGKPAEKKTFGSKHDMSPSMTGDKPAWKRESSRDRDAGFRGGDKPDWKREPGKDSDKAPRTVAKPPFNRLTRPDGGAGHEWKGRPMQDAGMKPPFKGPDTKPAWKQPEHGTGTDRRADRTGRSGQAFNLTPRRVALETLLDVSLRDAYAQLALDKQFRRTELDRRDRNFVTKLVYGTIEKRITLDYRINQVLEKPDELDPTAREILRMGAYQLFYLDRVPDMAATDESVQLTRMMNMEGLTGLVNGVLRNMIREKENVKWPTPEEDPVKYLSVMYSAPEVLCRMLIDQFGEHEALEILRYRLPKPYESIRPNLLRCEDARLRRLLADDEFDFEPGIVSGTYRVYNAGDMTQMRAYQNGLFVIQGESSVLAARAVGAKPGQTILDACAAPGGKTALISEMMQDSGRVYAWDTHPHRVQLIRGTAARLQIDNIRPVIRDAREPRPDQARVMDAALVDAPCSGSGVMHIKPDLRYRISPEGVADLVRIQSEILDTVADMVKPGGTLVYSTCSIFPEENEGQIKAFLERHREYSVAPLRNLLPESLRPLEGKNGIQLFAHRDNMDGFYICRMRRA